MPRTSGAFCFIGALKNVKKELRPHSEEYVRDNNPPEHSNVILGQSDDTFLPHLTADVSERDN